VVVESVTPDVQNVPEFARAHVAVVDERPEDAKSRLVADRPLHREIVLDCEKTRLGERRLGDTFTGLGVDGHVLSTVRGHSI
jgi:serine protease inhibitor ecotin